MDKVLNVLNIHNTTLEALLKLIENQQKKIDTLEYALENLEKRIKKLETFSQKY